jgi:hypothetical protein
VRRAVALAGIVCCALALAGTASATIVIGRGVAGVRLGMSQAAVRAKLGTPVKVVKAKNEFGPYTEFRYRGYVVDFQNNETVTAVATTLAREKTPSGVGVGSTWAQVRRKVPHLICTGSAVFGDCHVGNLLPGRTVTDFFVKSGKVVRVLVGIVID